MVCRVCVLESAVRCVRTSRESVTGQSCGAAAESGIVPICKGSGYTQPHGYNVQYTYEGKKTLLPWHDSTGWH